MFKNIIAAIFSFLIYTPSIAQDNVTLDRVFWVSPPKWYLLRQAAVLDNALWFRKYAFPVIDEKQQTGIGDIKNIISYGCQRSSRTWDFVAFHLPTWIHLNGIDSKGWISQLELRIAIDKASFTTVGEFRDREIFVDLNDDFRDQLLKLLISDKIIVEFGAKNERMIVYQMYRTQTGGNVVGYLDEMVPHLSSILKGGKVESLETETMLQKCLEFKRSGRY